ncbi:MAG: exosome complex protein Rrp42 [Nanoarchaeota archaeon]|nr:exosome complex protein Rrp42 [Nanoarchaeota archaeon]
MASNELKSHFIKLLNEGKRLDGRDISELRQPIKVEYGISKTAEGSAKVTMGDTEVLAGVKMEISEPYPDTPDQGTIMVGAELIPLSSPEFESGPPSIKAVELARVVDRGIRESKAIDFRKLCIKKGEKIWILLIDIVTLNDDGNLIDASALAALAALKDAKFPEVKDGAIDYKKKTDKSIDLVKEPIAVTVFKVGNHFIVDPTREEEKAIGTRLTITTTKNNLICALQKSGDSSLTQEDISRMIDIAIEKAKILREAL